MKKVFVIILILVTFLLIPTNVVNATSTSIDNDKKLEEIIDGISDENFANIVEFLNEIFNDNKSFKEWVVEFLTGELKFEFSNVFTYLKSFFKLYLSEFKSVLLYVVACAILCYISNIILSKNNEYNEKNTIFYISYIIAVTLVSSILFGAFNYVSQTVQDISKNTQVVFPVLFSLSSLIGSFGVQIFKPISVFISYFSSTLTTSFFIPILSLVCILNVLGNLSSSVKLKTLSVTLISLYKWSLGIISILFTVFVGSQTIVNAQYNGISVRILKYTTSSLVPIVGGFLSGGIDTLLSSALLVKNSIGFIAVIFILFRCVGGGLVLLVLSFLIKFYMGAVEPITDKKINFLLLGLADVLNLIASLVFICGYIYFVTVIGFIFSTATVV